MNTAPKFADGQAVEMRYTDWHRNTYQVDCFVHSSRFFEKSE